MRGPVKLITTVHAAGFDQYGARFLDGLRLWPAHQFTMYAEGFDPPCNHVRCESVYRLSAFKERHAHYRAPDWRFDVVRFANKAFAAYDAFYNHDGLGVWIDCDTVTHAEIPHGYIESLLPTDSYIAMFRRRGMHSETGFWIVNCAHPHHRKFLDSWIDLYESGAFKALPQWHDCETMDFALRRMERDNLLKVHSLSGEHDTDMHPMAKADIARYLDHCKGPTRKHLGRSPENTYRQP